MVDVSDEIPVKPTIHSTQCEHIWKADQLH